MRTRTIVSILSLCLLGGIALAKDAPGIEYPETKTVDAFDELHGHRIDDPYRWMEDDEAPDVIKWDHAQHAVLRARLDTWSGRDKWKALMDKEFGQPGMSTELKFAGNRRFYKFRPAGKNHPILYVTSADGKADPRVALDPNTWSEKGTAGLVDWAPSPDGGMVAYRRDDMGSEETVLYFRDLVTGQDLPDRITRTKHSPLVWAPDGSGIYYRRKPDPESVPKGEAQYHGRTYFHRLGTLPIDDQMVYGAGRPMLESGWIYSSSDEKHLFINRGMPWQNTETFEVNPTDGRYELVPIDVGGEARTFVDRVGNTYILNTNKFRGERDVYLMHRQADGTLGEWQKTAFTDMKGVKIDEVMVVGQDLVVFVTENLISRILVQSLAGGKVREVELPSPGNASGPAFKPGDSRLWFRFASYSTAPTTFRVDLEDPKLTLHAEETLSTTLEVGQLVSERYDYPSKDGTKIPLWILRRKDVALDGKAPTILYGYGGFRVSLLPRFSRTRALWCLQGGVFAVANLRGGEEFGDAWHAAGCLGNKQNVFDDFIAAADWLVREGKATRERLAVQGGSNGGLLVAAVVTQRPDLVRAGISEVPLTDMLRFHRFQFAKSWTKEYGDPDIEEEFEWIRPYSPYHNVKDGTAYPAMMVTAGLKDGRVNAFHARKMAARWQAATTSPHPILLLIDRESGHGSSNLDKYKAELLDQMSFLHMELLGQK